MLDALLCLLCHPFTIHPRELGAKCSFLIPGVLKIALQSLSNLFFVVVEGEVEAILSYDMGIFIYFIQTQLNLISLAWLCMPNVICYFSLSLPCIINKWHLDFIKVPGPLWQYNVTGGRFNISRERLGWYYLRQPVAPEEEEEKERCHDSGYRCLEGCVVQEPQDCIEQVKVHSQPGSILRNCSH